MKGAGGGGHSAPWGRCVPKNTPGQIGLNGEGLTEVQKVKGLTSVQNSISSFKLFSFNKNQPIEAKGQTLNQSRAWLRAEIYFSFTKKIILATGSIFFILFFFSYSGILK